MNIAGPTDITALLHTFISNPKAQTSEDPRVICRLALAEINRQRNYISAIENAVSDARKSFPGA